MVWRAISRFADTNDPGNEEGEAIRGLIQRDHITYELSQLCGQVYLYKGYILQDRYKYQIEHRHPYLLMEHDFRDIAQKIFASLPAFHQGTDLDKKILWGMASVVGVYGRKYRQTSENRARSNSRLPCLFENVGPFKTIFGVQPLHYHRSL